MIHVGSYYYQNIVLLHHYKTTTVESCMNQASQPYYWVGNFGIAGNKKFTIVA